MTPTEASVVWLNAPGELEIRTEPFRVRGDRDLVCETK
jgi:hypothetical protein